MKRALFFRASRFRRPVQALIEGSREVVTDSSGQYTIVNLRPGTYTVTFTLTGFSTFRRENILLEANFAAQVNGEMRLGSVAESVTVSGEAPIVDVRNATQAAGADAPDHHGASGGSRHRSAGGDAAGCGQRHSCRRRADGDRAPRQRRSTAPTPATPSG
jgi:hypothetical protein